VEPSVHRPSPPNTFSYVQEENLGSARKFVESYLLFLCIRIHLNWCRRLNKFSSPRFGDCTFSYILIQSDIRYTYVLIRSTYVLYDKTSYIQTL
jgi:hypothetical protein